MGETSAALARTAYHRSLRPFSPAALDDALHTFRRHLRILPLVLFLHGKRAWHCTGTPILQIDRQESGRRVGSDMDLDLGSDFRRSIHRVDVGRRG